MANWTGTKPTVGFKGLFAALPLLAAQPLPAAGQSSGFPAWLDVHVGEGGDQIAPLVLRRARADTSKYRFDCGFWQGAVGV